MNDAVGEENNLASEAVARIRTWLVKREALSGKISTPRLAVKFCGGCNPSFDRGAVARILRRNLRDVCWVHPEEESDLLLIINGCSTCCAERPEVQGNALENLVICNRSVSVIKKRGEI